MLKRNLTVLAALAVAASLTVAGCGGSGSDGPAASGPVTIELVGGQPEGGVTTITVKKGDTVTFTVESDTEGDVHVHGYDIEKAVAPGQPAVFELTANLEGVFDVEAHASGAKIAKLVVEP
jgi:plastocyanin